MKVNSFKSDHLTSELGHQPQRPTSEGMQGRGDLDKVVKFGSNTPSCNLNHDIY